MARRSLVELRAIASGEAFTEQNIICKRPATGLSPNHLWELLGKMAKRRYAADELIDVSEL